MEKRKPQKMLCLDDIVNVIAGQCNMNKSEIKTVVTLFRDSIIESIREGNSVYIVNGWTFELIETKAKELKNPKTKKIIKIEPGAKVKVKLSNKIREAAKDAFKEMQK
jgi:nucleoid DNA-binding protein